MLVHDQPLRLRHGFTLVELLVVLTILVALAGLVTALVTAASGSARHDVTLASMARVRQAMAMYSMDMQKPPAFMADLLRNPGNYPPYDPQTRKGWNGPYLQHSGAQYTPDARTIFTTIYGEGNTPTLLDGWGNPLVIQRGIWDGTKADLSKDSGLRVVSAGEDGILQCPPGERMPDRVERGDDRVDRSQAVPEEADLVLFYDQADEMPELPSP